MPFLGVLSDFDLLTNNNSKNQKSSLKSKEILKAKQLTLTS
jgi:hypothetical protein